MRTNTLGRRSPWQGLSLVVAIGLSATLLAASPVDATQFLKTETYAGEEDDAFEFCGIDVDYHLEFSGRVRIRAGKGKQAGVFFLQDKYSAVETFTNPENGKFFTVSHNGIFQDIKATRVDGNIFEFVSHEAGQPFVVRDMHGNVLLRDRGLITQTYLFDVGDDNEPGGEFLVDLDLRVSGPHPGFFIVEGEECPAVIDLLS